MLPEGHSVFKKILSKVPWETKISRTVYLLGTPQHSVVAPTDLYFTTRQSRGVEVSGSYNLVLLGTKAIDTPGFLVHFILGMLSISVGLT